MVGVGQNDRVTDMAGVLINYVNFLIRIKTGVDRTNRSGCIYVVYKEALVWYILHIKHVILLYKAFLVNSGPVRMSSDGYLIL